MTVGMTGGMTARGTCHEQSVSEQVHSSHLQWLHQDLFIVEEPRNDSTIHLDGQNSSASLEFPSEGQRGGCRPDEEEGVLSAATVVGGNLVVNRASKMSCAFTPVPRRFKVREARCQCFEVAFE
jgi:hypothetical protein